VYERIVVVTRKTRLEGLVERFNTKAQARFYIERSEGDFDQYQVEHDVYADALGRLRRQLDLGLKLQFVDRSFLPTLMLTEHDLVVTVGQDGLVANVAKYVAGQPIVAVNPDPARFDGILLPFAVDEARRAVAAVVEGAARERRVTLARARLADGQRLLAFNDLYIGVRSHTSARYRLTWQGTSEKQSSSGIIVSTGAGSTGWLSSVVTMADAVAAFLGGTERLHPELRLPWDTDRLVFVVREPFVSRHSTAEVVAGMLEPGAALTLESAMPTGGVIFSDGVEADFLDFNAGAVVEVGAAEDRVRLVVP